MDEKDEIKNLAKKLINNFKKNDDQTEVFFPKINGKKIFIKIAGKNRSKYIKNEIKALRKLKKIIPFYKNYFITSLSSDNKNAIILKYIHGLNVYDSLLEGSDKNIKTDNVVDLYKKLLKKIKIFHENNLTHGDIKLQNIFFCFEDKKDDPQIEFIDMESVNDFTESDGIYNNIISRKYDFPFKIKRSNIIFKDKNNAFLFYKYLDIYSITISMFYLYKKEIYNLVGKNKDKDKTWHIEGELKSPIDFVNKSKNRLERAFYYVFSFLPLLKNADKKGEVPDINIDINYILKMI
jgi:serine/threonine protein kinase